MKSTPTDTLPTDHQRDAERVLKILARWDEKMQGHQTQKRAKERCTYPARMAVYHHGIKARPGQEGDGSPIAVWARNVSELGVGFIYRGRIPAKRVVLCLDPDTGGSTWLLVEIVRARQVHNEFWDYGAKFIGRSSREDAEGSSRSKR